MEGPEEKEATERFIREEAVAFSQLSEFTEPMHRKSLTESDAVHPRFIKEDSEGIHKYEVENMYFCKQCNLFFAPSVRGLRSHFDKNRVDHKAYGSCFYCKGRVYEYSQNNELRVYHNCKDEESDSS